MRVGVVGDFSADLDEGFKNTGHYLAVSLQKRHEVQRIDIRTLGSVTAWRKIVWDRPDVFHVITQPTSPSLGFAAAIRRLLRAAPVVISAMRPEKYFRNGSPSISQRALVRLAAPSLVLVQSRAAEDTFTALGCRCMRFANGVDLDKFRAACPGEKGGLRRKYGLDLERPVVLHVGHLEPDRNLSALADLPALGMQVVIAGSLYMGTHQQLIAELEYRGLKIFKGYVPDVAELYRLADCYVFTPPPGNSLSMPLSVLEAMATNLPVVTTPFEGLREAFVEGPHFRFADPGSTFYPHIRSVLESPEICTNRVRVEPFSWDVLACRLETCYGELVA